MNFTKIKNAHLARTVYVNLDNVMSIFVGKDVKGDKAESTESYFVGFEMDLDCVYRTEAHFTSESAAESWAEKVIENDKPKKPRL